MEAASATPSPALVGRRRELALVWDQFLAAAEGRLRAALVAGEPGIGKTSLLNELGARAAREGATVLRGGASDAEGMPPYLPFLEAFGQHIRSTQPAMLREQAGDAATTLATILPELALRLDALPAGYPLPPDQARMRLYEAVGTFLAAIAARHTLLLILDDLHWADTASLDLLCYVARQRPEARLLVLGAYRASEVALNPALDRALAELNRLRLLTTVTIGALTAADVDAIAAGYLGAPVDSATCQVLAAKSEGNPFFAEELLRGWMESGALRLVGQRWTLDAPLDSIPAGIVGAVHQRLARLPEETVEYLCTAAIIGRTFDVALLADALGQEVETVEERLSDAVRMHVIRPEAGTAFTFSHDTIRECLYAEVTPARRKRLHGFIGHALEGRRELDLGRQLAELAFHFTRSGDRERGATYAQQAAEQALRAYAPAEALSHYRAALDLLDATDVRRGQLLLSLGETAILAGVEREAVTAFEAARAWFEQAGDLVAAATAAHELGRAWWRQEVLPEARGAFEAALALLADRPVPRKVEVLVDLGSLLAVSLHQQAEGLAYGRQALELAHALEDDRLVAAATRTVGNLLVRGNDLAAGIALLEAALALAVAADDLIEAAECCACLYMAYAWNGDFHRMEDLAQRWLTFARRCHDPYQLRHISSLLAMLYGIQGRWAAAEQLIAQAQQAVERLASPEPLAFLQFIRGVSAYERGDYAAAEELLTAATTTFRAIGPGALVWYLGWLGLAQIARGKRQEALACMAELEAFVATLPTNTMPTAGLLSHLSMLALAMGDRERALRYYPRLIAFRGQWQDALVDRLLGQIEILQRDWQAAQVSLEAAEATARRGSMKSELARTLVARADLALAQAARDAKAQARALLGEAIGLFEQIGNASTAQSLRDRLAGLAGGAAQRPALPAGLSEREVEVLRLVVAGKSNREIAHELTLSEKTVANHLTNIFTKTGADNRAAATAFAFRHGLA